MLQFGTKRFVKKRMSARTKSEWVTVPAVVTRLPRSRTAPLAVLATVLGLVAASSALASQTSRPAASGRAGQAHQALLELYALDSRLEGAQARVAYLASETTKLRRQRAALRSEL